MEIFTTAMLPKLPKEIGPHPMDNLIYSLRHMVAAYCFLRQQEGCLVPTRIHCVQESLKTLGNTFRIIALEFKDEPAIAGQIHEASNRYYDIAKDD